MWLGNLYFTDRCRCSAQSGHRRLLQQWWAVVGQVMRPMGHTASQAKLAQPYGLAVAADGTLYIADSQNHCVRRVTAQGVLETVAGCPTALAMATMAPQRRRPVLNGAWYGLV